MTDEQLQQLGWNFYARSVVRWFTLPGNFRPDFQNFMMYGLKLGHDPENGWTRIQARFGPGGEHETIYDGQISDPIFLKQVMESLGLVNPQLPGLSD